MDEEGCGVGEEGFEEAGDFVGVEVVGVGIARMRCGRGRGKGWKRGREWGRWGWKG